MTNNSTKLAMYAVLAAAALMCCARPAGPAAAATTASVPPASCATDALAVKCRNRNPAACTGPCHTASR